MKHIQRAASLFMELLRELSDEGPYSRYLAARGVSASPEEWRRFSSERQNAHFKRPKCC